MASKIANKYMEFIGTGVGVSSFRARALQNSCDQASSVGVSSFRARVLVTAFVDVKMMC